jgi:hypothetical protein
MEKHALIEQLKQFTEAEDLLSVGAEAKELKTQFDDLILKEENQHQIAQLEAQERGETMENYHDPLNETFRELYATFQEKRKAQLEAQRAEENENLKQKKLLLAQLQSVIEEEEHIGKAYATQKEIQEKWKQIGDIARDKRQEIQKEYSRLMEVFFYNIKIYKELKDHDLRRNQQLKSEIIEKLKALTNHPVIKEVEQELKTLQHEWEEIGPTFQAEWDAIKDEYWGTIKGIYERIKEFYDAKREEMQQNIERKRELIGKTTEIQQASLQASTHKDWDELTAKLLAIQEEWKTIGFGPRKENEEVWKEFRGICDTFFAAKKAYYQERSSEFDTVKAKKEELIGQANALKDNTDWKETTQRILQIQQNWKKLGSAGPKFEQKLWKEFRAACDAFFNNKQAHFDALDSQNAQNLTAKEALIAKIVAYQPTEDKKQTLVDLKNFAQEFNAIGNVPFKEKDRIFNAYKQALDKHYNDLDLKGAEKEKVLFKAKLDTIAASPNADRLLDDERRTILQQIQKLEQEIRQLDNNLGFFGRSKGADALKKEVEKKITDAQRRIAEHKLRLSLIDTHE